MLLLGYGEQEEDFEFSVGFFLLAHVFNLGDSDTCISEVKERHFAIAGGQDEYIWTL